MNDLCVELGYNSINHVGEELCGDHVETAGQGEDSQVLVLAADITRQSEAIAARFAKAG